MNQLGSEMRSWLFSPQDFNCPYSIDYFWSLNPLLTDFLILCNIPTLCLKCCYLTPLIHLLRTSLCFCSLLSACVYLIIFLTRLPPTFSSAGQHCVNNLFQCHCFQESTPDLSQFMLTHPLSL